MDMQGELMAGCFKAILEKCVEPILKKMKDFSSEQWNEFLIDFDIAFRKYTEKSYTKYSKVKTILYRTEPKYIYDFFEPPILKLNQVKFIKTENINDVLEISHFLIIQGIGGIGKSMLMKHLFLNELVHNDLVPIFFELKEINTITNWKLEDIIQHKLEILGYNLKKKYLDYALQSGCFLFLLDGCDEIISEKKSRFLQELEEFCDKYEKNYYVISSRPYSEFIEFQRFTILETCQFTKQQALSMVQRLDFDKEIKDKFINALDKELYEHHQSFASNPLLLNIMLLTFDNYAEIPGKLYIFYENAFETMCFKHDATKAGFKREWKSKLPIDTFQKVFSEFCIVTYANLKIEFSYPELEDKISKILNRLELHNVHADNYIDDLVNTLCIIYKDGTLYRYTHRSFQEYFVALFLSQLSDYRMKDIGLNLIKRNIDMARSDSVFDMLYDMNSSRFEDNILLPLLHEYEQDRGDQDGYDFYFMNLFKTILFPYTIDNGSIISNGLGAAVRDGKLIFLDEFTKYYYPKIKSNKGLEETLFMHLLNSKIVNSSTVNNLGNSKQLNIDSIELKKDKYAYDLMRKTWIGIHAENLSTFYTLLSKQNNQNDKAIAELLNL